ncbi:hypothetical protein HKD37_12G033793 [Glycine soja]
MEMMNEDQKNWNEMAKTMMKINKKTKKIDDNMHSVTYNQDLVNLTILAGWIELRDFYGLIGNRQVTMLILYRDVSSTMYSFIKAARFTHLNLEGITECKIVYNH